MNMDKETLARSAEVLCNLAEELHERATESVQRVNNEVVPYMRGCARQLIVAGNRIQDLELQATANRVMIERLEAKLEKATDSDATAILNKVRQALGLGEDATTTDVLKAANDLLQRANKAEGRYEVACADRALLLDRDAKLCNKIGVDIGADIVWHVQKLVAENSTLRGKAHRLEGEAAAAEDAHTADKHERLAKLVNAYVLLPLYKHTLEREAAFVAVLDEDARNELVEACQR
jgi:hypothetical protein